MLTRAKDCKFTLVVVNTFGLSTNIGNKIHIGGLNKMYVGKKELIEIIEGQVERRRVPLSSFAYSEENKVKRLKEVLDKLINSIGIPIDAVVCILADEANDIDRHLTTKKNAMNFELEQRYRRIMFTIEELNKIKLRVEYKEVLEEDYRYLVSLEVE